MRWHRLVVLLALAGCSSAGQCPQIGCPSQLTLRLPAAVTAAEACVADVCTSTVVDGALLVPLGRRADGDTAAVTVTVPGTATAYEGVVPLVRTRPNGANCPPVCVNGSAVLDIAGARVVAGPAQPAPSASA